MTMKYRLIIFDMDGTILDTLKDLTDSLNYALKKSGFPQRTIEEVRGFVGNGIQKLIERGVPKETKREEIQKVFEDFTDYYSKHCADTTKPYDGILKVLLELKKSGYLTAVVSNKADYAVRALCDEYFKGIFDAVSGERENIRKKPAPDTVNAVLEELNVLRKEAIYIGDSEVDIKTAENAGMDSISVDWGFRSREELLKNNAKKIISNPKDILNEIL